MESPKSRQHKEKRLSYRRREHKNKKFYNSKVWRDTREVYIRAYEFNMHESVKKYTWQGMALKAHQVGYLLSLSFLPCETCLRFYAAEAYDKVEEGKELDHIEPVNPENATDRVELEFTDEPGYKYGDPYSFDNLQLLCKRHHAKKSQRER